MKKWYASRTVWVNVLALGASVFGVPLDPTIQLAVLSGINLVLRKITKSEITW